MKNIWIKIIEAIFPGSYEEYLEAKKIHTRELKRYRTNPQYIVGFFLFFIPTMYMFLLADGWKWKIIALCMVFGEIFLRDTVSEHYCVIIHRERKLLSSMSIGIEENGQPEKTFAVNNAKVLVVCCIWACIWALLSSVFSNFFDISPNLRSNINMFGPISGLWVFNELAQSGKIAWFLKK